MFETQLTHPSLEHTKKRLGIRYLSRPLVTPYYKHFGAKQYEQQQYHWT
jgi:hypothetical protein